ncbi:copper chaperone PCu(A)C [Rheinheimera texasensis]|uniref:copper chaperone PCu(A)C n=1 Tax=Rheinheimera texasensis TaxID=306205 RepID=UPI0032B23697
MRQFVLFAASLFTFNLWAAQVDITNATVREPLPGKSLSAGYFSLHNKGAVPVALVSVSSNNFGAIELHTHQMVDGMMQMTQVDQMVVEPGQQVHLQPGGLHLMLFRPVQKISLGQQVQLRLQWSDGSSQEVQASVTRIPKQ